MDILTQVLRRVLKEFPGLEFRTEEPLKNHTSFKIGGPVNAMLFPENTGELSALISIMGGFGIRPLIIGNGTNLLASDKPLDLIAIKTSGLSGFSLTGGEEITAGCGVPLSRLAVFACENGLSGLEFAHGIPGTLGGAVLMNAGAYGSEMKDITIKTEALGGDGIKFVSVGEEQGFSYRKSRFSDAADVILSSVLKLRRGNPEEIRAVMDDLAKRRRESQPLNLPSAGSTFKRPADGYAAALIEQSGLKGYSAGGAQVSEKHAGFVVNRGGASFDDVISVIEHVRETILSVFGTELELEIKIIR